MRASLALCSLLAVSPLIAQVHEATPVDDLMHAIHQGTLAPAHVQVLDTPVPEASTKVFDIDVRNFAFTVVPSPFVVDQGDTVTLRLKMANGTHGFFMETYVNATGLVIGQTVTKQFVATTPGTFTYFCTNSGCGTGHGNMFGTFTVNAVVDTAPTITSVDPAAGTTAGGTTLTIKGTNFVSGATVKIGSVDATNVTVVDATTITAKTPLGPTSEEAGFPRDVTVTNPNLESATKTAAFSYVVPPLAVSSIDPASAGENGGVTVTIKGEGFTSAVRSFVTFGGAEGSAPVIVDAVTMTVMAPPHKAGTVDVVVNVGEQSVTKPAAFTYDATKPKRRAARP